MEKFDIKVLAGTGHRPSKIGGYKEEAHLYRLKLLTKVLNKLKPEKVISGMALGFDIELAEAAISLNIPLLAAIPFINQDKIWPEKSKIIYQELLNKASEKVIVCEGEYVPWKMQKRNIFMVDSCNLLLALYNGTKGGTQNCVKYAESKNKPILNIWELFKY